MKKNDIISISWLDQNSYHQQTDGAGALTKVHGITIGYLLEEDEEWICIASERMKFVGFAGYQYRHVVSIPKCCITKSTILKKATKED